MPWGIKPCVLGRLNRWFFNLLDQFQFFIKECLNGFDLIEIGLLAIDWAIPEQFH